ncbi:unnamed protein product [Gongylonema pulchrum]|uniref:Uncharacterized protein n=1 Tax=Gongylonema pulchrum TaxID=637853 RepID=A0A183CXM9_9BILA|nr:unnamed protein product [Gongylonema pulchrum]
MLRGADKIIHLQGGTSKSVEDWKIFVICSNCPQKNQRSQPALALIFKKPSYMLTNSAPERESSLLQSENNHFAYFLKCTPITELHADDLLYQVVRILRNNDTSGFLLPKTLLNSPAIAVKVIAISAKSLNERMKLFIGKAKKESFEKIFGWKKKVPLKIIYYNIFLNEIISSP